MNKIKICSNDKILNIKTNRCVLKNGKIGKKILEEENINNPILKRILKDNNKKRKKVIKEENIDNPILKKTLKDKKKKKIIEKENINTPILKKKLNPFNDYKKYILSYNINKIRANEFINKCDISVRPIVKKIIDNTTHISFETFYLYLLKNIRALLNEYLNLKKIFFKFKNQNSYSKKSNFWISSLVKDIIIYECEKRKRKEIEIIYISSFFDDERIEENDVILLIDDCIYSGMQIKENFLDLGNKKFSDLKDLIINKSLNIYIFVSFIHKNKIEEFKKLNLNLKFCKYIHNFKKTNEILTNNEIKSLEIFYHSFNDKYLIYFDHKLADEVSTIPLFYSGLVLNKKNKEIINSIIKEILLSIYDKKMDLLDFYPFIENCEKIRNVDIFEPLCPYPPYKNENKYKELLKTVLKNKKNKSL